MKGVTLYEPVVVCDSNDSYDCWGEMRSSVFGEYVCLDDYKALQKELDHVKELIYELYRSV